MIESWKAIPGWEGLYEVSDQGRVRRLLRRCGTGAMRLGAPAIVTPKGTGKGYLGVTLARSGKKTRRYIHALMLEAFVGPAPPGHEAAHGDGIRTRNVLDNLEWKTRAANHADKHRHGTALVGEMVPTAKLTEVAVLAIRASTETCTVLAERHGVCRSLISLVRRKQIWRHV